MLERFIHRKRDIYADGPVTREAGVIPFTIEDGEPVFLLVTSRRTGRWIFPKGVCRKDEAAAACASREAFEEAGIEGDLAAKPVGAYRDIKHGAGPLLVELYPFAVRRQLDDWPEKKLRKRHWATLDEARLLLTTPGLYELAAQAHHALRAQAQIQARQTSSAAQ